MHSARAANYQHSCSRRHQLVQTQKLQQNGLARATGQQTPSSADIQAMLHCFEHPRRAVSWRHRNMTEYALAAIQAHHVTHSGPNRKLSPGMFVESPELSSSQKDVLRSLRRELLKRCVFQCLGSNNYAITRQSPEKGDSATHRHSFCLLHCVTLAGAACCATFLVSHHHFALTHTRHIRQRQPRPGSFPQVPRPQAQCCRQNSFRRVLYLNIPRSCV